MSPHRLRRTWIQIACMALVGLLATAAAAGTLALPRPQGPVLLQVTGAIAVTNDGAAASFDRAMLEAMPQHRMETYTDWTEGLQVFEGPLLADLLARVGARGDSLHATALNDYAVDIPATDPDEYPVLLALRHNGQPMSVRNKGPIWIVYPNPDPESAKASPHNEKSIWQLRSVDVR